MPDPDPQNMPAAPSESTIFMALSWPLMANFGVISILFFIGYSILTISLLLKHQKNIGTVFSQNENQISLKWIYMLPASFITLVLLNIANEHSDIDIVITSRKKDFFLRDDLKEYLEANFKIPVDVGYLDSFRAYYKSKIEKEIIYV